GPPQPDRRALPVQLATGGGPRARDQGEHPRPAAALRPAGRATTGAGLVAGRSRSGAGRPTGQGAGDPLGVLPPARPTDRPCPTAAPGGAATARLAADPRFHPAGTGHRTAVTHPRVSNVPLNRVGEQDVVVHR